MQIQGSVQGTLYPTPPPLQDDAMPGEYEFGSDPLAPSDTDTIFQGNRMFCTVLHNLKSPENIGIIVRAHVAFGGDEIIVISSTPWKITKRTQAFSRKLEKLCNLIFFKDDNEFFDWCKKENISPIAIEITSPPNFLPNFKFPKRSAIVVGNEGIGLSEEFLQRCSTTITIPQYGQVECLNSAVSCCIAMYELVRQQPTQKQINKSRYIV